MGSTLQVRWRQFAIHAFQQAVVLDANNVKKSILVFYTSHRYTLREEFQEAVKDPRGNAIEWRNLPNRQGETTFTCGLQILDYSNFELSTCVVLPDGFMVPTKSRSVLGEFSWFICLTKPDIGVQMGVQSSDYYEGGLRVDTSQFFNRAKPMSSAAATTTEVENATEDMGEPEAQ